MTMYNEDTGSGSAGRARQRIADIKKFAAQVEPDGEDLLVRWLFEDHWQRWRRWSDPAWAELIDPKVDRSSRTPRRDP
jgi:hypothetical protein